MLPNVSALPSEHRHGANSSTYLRCNVEQIGIDLATIQHTIGKLPLVRYEIEQERELFPPERYGFLDPRVDISLACQSALNINPVSASKSGSDSNSMMRRVAAYPARERITLK